MKIMMRPKVVAANAATTAHAILDAIVVQRRARIQLRQRSGSQT